MRNKYFDELVTENDLFYVCFMIEKTSRFLHQRNQYVVIQLGYDHLYHLISVANVLHSDNPDKEVHDLIDEYKLEYGSFHVENVNSELCSHIPTELEMGILYFQMKIIYKDLYESIMMLFVKSLTIIRMVLIMNLRM